MKNLELQNFGVVEMDAKEMKETTGGGFFGALLGFLVGVVASGFITFEANGQEASAENNWVLGGLFGASIGSLLPF